MRLFNAVLFVSVGYSVSVFMTNDKYEQVGNIVLAEIDANTLSVVSTQAMRNTKSACLSFCTANPSCYLACYNGSFCIISSALITPYWKPIASPSQALRILTGYKCFSSWNFENDLTTNIVNTTVSGSAGNAWDKSYAIDGYYTDSLDTHFSSALDAAAWFKIDMGIAYEICKVIVKVRKSLGNGFVRYTNVEVRVGNLNTTGDFTGNALLGYLSGPAIQGQLVIYNQYAPLVGRYISFQQKDLGWLVIGEIKVIGCQAQ